MTRKDGLTKVFKYFIGPVIHKEKTDVTTQVIVKTVQYHNDTLFDDVKTDFRGNPLYSNMITKLSCPERNQMILKIIQYELKQNPSQQIMILAHTKQIIQDLYEGIQIFEPSVGFYVGGMKENALKESETKKCICATYSMASEGLDIKTLTTLIMATPKSDVCQSVGRILRSKHSKPLVIDIIDPHTVFKNQYKKRLAYYKGKQFIVENYKDDNAYFKKEEKIEREIKCLIKL